MGTDSHGEGGASKKGERTESHSQLYLSFHVARIAVGDVVMTADLILQSLVEISRLQVVKVGMQLPLSRREALSRVDDIFNLIRILRFFDHQFGIRG